jgi:inner membrane protein
MDNLCHTLVGAALAQSGLKRRSPLGMATLVIGANLPDVDVISLAWGSTAGLAFRRGWTHGVLALPLWPFVLAAAVVLFDRAVTKRGARFWPLVGLAAVGVFSHPLLDLLNTYGVRWLMPFSSAWYYGDTLFIVDVWVWLMLAAGVLLSERRERKGNAAWPIPARAALAAATLYTVGMFLLGRLAVSQVRFELRAAGVTPARVLASPLPLTPFARDVVVDEGDGYLVGRIRASGNFVEEGHWPKRNPLDEAEDPALALAASTPAAETFLRWARYPTYLVDRRGGATVVHFIDLRYARQPSAPFGTLAVPVFTTQVAVARAEGARATAAAPARSARPPVAARRRWGECRLPG